ncbi:MAG TPA: hypothetical protein VGB68_14555 [Pyrinomonadaceae bacterium]|jgi:hypothetical protein
MGRTIPFDPSKGIAPARLSALNGEAKKKMDVHAADGSLNFTEFGAMLSDILSGPYNENEKCYIWTRIAHTKGQYVISNVGLRKENIDSYRPGTSAGHVVIGFDDGYHCPLANLSTEDAIAGIKKHEKNEGGAVGAVGRKVFETFGGPPVNIGDEAASMNQILALKAFIKEGFPGYVREWRALFLM